jgi:hypothetical protein
MLVTLHRIGLSLAIALTLSTALIAAKTVHLLGFVDELCPDEPHCFELTVKPEFVAEVGAHIKVRFTSATRIYDPENYELTLEQQNIVPGSHLRMLIEAEADGETGVYQASFIWIGD